MLIFKHVAVELQVEFSSLLAALFAISSDSPDHDLNSIWTNNSLPNSKNLFGTAIVGTVVIPMIVIHKKIIPFVCF